MPLTESFQGSAFLHFWDRATLSQVRKLEITRLNGSKAKNINELELWRDRVVANVWYEHVILIINPVTGLVEKEYGKVCAGGVPVLSLR